MLLMSELTKLEALLNSWWVTGPLMEIFDGDKRRNKEVTLALGRLPHVREKPGKKIDPLDGQAEQSQAGVLGVRVGRQPRNLGCQVGMR